MRLLEKRVFLFVPLARRLFYLLVKSINLASNMISGEGLELFLDDLIVNTTLQHLDVGVAEGSMRKKSLGIQAVCVAAMHIRNKTLESLSINDNDLGADGGECVGIALS
jgi:hypothetical protein